MGFETVTFTLSHLFLNVWREPQGLVHGMDGEEAPGRGQTSFWVEGRGGLCAGHKEKRASLIVTGAPGLRNEEEEE